MRRRTLLQSLAGGLVARPLISLRAQSPASADLTEANVAALHAIGEVVLPASLGERGRRVAIEKFVGWVRNYKSGADRGHGYGASALTAPTGPSPALQYPAQFAALDAQARPYGAATFAALTIDQRRAVVEVVLNTPQPVTRMPARPSGQNLIADLMGFYFNGAEAQNLAYNARIDRDSCRSLDGSDRPPPPLDGSGN